MDRRVLVLFSLSVAILFCINACSTVNPYTGEQQTSKLAIGAGIGAASGALIGALTAKDKNKRKHALIGAGVGAVAGGSVGYYMDVQEANLRRELQSTGVSVTRNGDSIVLNMPGNVTFASGSYDLRPEFHTVLNSVAKVLNKYNKTVLDVIGHTDSVGNDSDNQVLSENRANSVAIYLTSQNVLSQRILTAGYGESQPIASNSTDEGRAQNRRVTIQMTPITNQ